MLVNFARISGLRTASSSQRLLPVLLSASEACFSSSATSSQVNEEIDDAPIAELIAGLQEKFRLKPEFAKTSFTSKSVLTTGLRSTCSIRDKFQVHCDEPLALGGTDLAPNPVELVLAALGSCQEITWKAYAQATSTPIQSVSVELQGDIDLRGFFGVSKEARPGFHAIHGTVTVHSSAKTENLENLKKMVDAHCSVLDMLQHVPILIKLVHKQQGYS